MFVKMLGVTRFPPLTPDQPMLRPMSQFKPLPPLAELQDRFAYDPDTGIFCNTYTRSSNAKKGAVTGSLHYQRGVPHCVYLQISKRRFMAHRVAHYLMTGVDPLSKEVDHIDRNPFNNKFSNLRLANDRQNSANNSRRAKGWVRYKDRFYAQIRINNKLLSLGGYSTPEEAHEVYKAKHIQAD